MKKLIAVIGIVLIGLFVVVSCDNKPNNAVDGYYFEQETFTRNSFVTEIVLAGSRAELKQLYLDKGGKDANDLAAFAVVSQVQNRCTIYMIDPRVHYEPEYIGHELVHCIYGDWHKSQ